MDESSFEPGLERTLRALVSAARSHSPESEEHAAISLAARSLLFLHHSGQLEAFREWLASPSTVRASSLPIRSFHSMGDALVWLEGQPEDSTGSLVEVERETYVIALGPTGSFVLVRTVTQHAPVGG
ncbi:hypothetical protein JRI60_04410 [Archangium violaceum]|uniref:hypothetical protein n=1 Tax=Archangium violaceum TaxID=83451 RepID=UPI00194E2929|nr:hypothetical protein [Archangium violaceum]QRN98317.1 hypothetical protein JRI60_04410 [Archangium violaceum]